MKSITHEELRTDTTRILREVQAGETMEITDHGETVAVLIPVPADRRERLIRTGEVRPAASRPDFRATRRIRLPDGAPDTQEVLDELRGER